MKKTLSILLTLAMLATVCSAMFVFEASAEAADHLIAGMASAGKQESLSAEATSPSILVFSYESTSVNTKTREKAFSKEIEKGKPRYKIDEIYHF